MDELEVHIIYLIDSRAHNNLFSVISFDPQKYKDDREDKVIRSGNRQSGITYWADIRSKLGENAYRPFAED